MKTIKERVKDYSDSHGNLYMDSAEEKQIYKGDLADAFIAGAKSERKDLTRWHHPNVELPETDVEVLVKIDAPGNKYDIMKHNQQGWWQKAPGGGWCAPNNAPIGWRHIHELYPQTYENV